MFSARKFFNKGKAIQDLSWDLIEKINPLISDDLGSTFASVSLNHEGNLLAIGEKRFDNSNGAVQILKYDSNESWSSDLMMSSGGLLSSEIGGQGRFGSQVRLARGYDQFGGAAKGTDLVVGEPGNNRANVYFRVNFSGIDWDSSGYVSENTFASGFGGSVAINRFGNFIAVGYGGDINLQTSGSVKLFENSSGFGWAQVGQEIIGPQNSRLGNNISMKSEGPNENATSNPGILLLGTDSLDPSVYGFGRVISCSDSCENWSAIGSDIVDEGSRFFGYYVSMNYTATSIIVSGLGSSGRISKVFNLVDGSWIQFGKTLEGSVSKMCYLGNRVATNSLDGLRIYQKMSDDWSLVAFIPSEEGQPFFDIDLSGSGRVLVATNRFGVYAYKQKGHSLPFFVG